MVVSMRWGASKRSAIQCMNPDKSSIFSDRETMSVVMAQRKEKSVNGRFDELTRQGARPGLIVRMKRTGRLKVIVSIDANGRVLMDGARIPCSPDDYDFIQGFR